MPTEISLCMSFVGISLFISCSEGNTLPTWMCVLAAQSCPTLCNPIDRSPPGPSIHGILQARTLEWVAISFSKRNYRKKESEVSCVRLFVTPWTVAYQAPPSMEFSRQECWTGLLFPSAGDLPDPGIEPRSPTLQADALLSELPGKPLL